MTAQKVEQPFRFSAKALTQLNDLFTGVASGSRFIADAQRIVGKHLLATNDYGRLPAARQLQTDGRALQLSAQKLAETLRGLGAGERELLGQFMWLVDKRSYYPSASSVDRLAEGLAVLGLASQKFSQAGRGGRPSLQVSGLIREIHASYVIRFRKKAEISAAKTNAFAATVKICLAAAGAPVKGLLQAMKDALGGDQ